MHDVITLLKPRIIAFKNGGRSKRKHARALKTFVLGIIGALFWSGLFAISLRVLLYFKGIEDIGDILNHKLLSMLLITAFALLIFSSILTSLSKLYLSRDLFLVHAMPVSSCKIFIARWIDSTIDSSWMVIIYSLPVFIAFGAVYDTGLFFYISAWLSIISLVLVSSGLGAAMVMIAVMVVPANRMKNIFVFMGILFFVILYLAVRLMKPELMVDPEVFDTVLVYVTALQTPSSPLLPSTWAFDGIKAALEGSVAGSLFHMGLAWSFAGALFFINLLIADFIYYKGFTKTQTAQVRLVKGGSWLPRFTGLLPGSIKAFTEKEIKCFFRDQSQWSQLFLIAALVIIYIYNFKVLPLEKSPIKTVYLQNVLSFLNMGLALFVLTAVAGRFAYPAVSAEGESFWIVKSSPGSLSNFIWIKFFIYFIPLLILTEILIIITNLFLQVTDFMMVLSTATVFLLVPGIVAMGIGFGAAYPEFRAENPAQTVTSFGGLVFMMLCTGFIGTVIVLEAGPVYHIFMADLRERSLTFLEWSWATGAFTAVIGLSIAAIFLPMRFGAKKLAQYHI